MQIDLLENIYQINERKVTNMEKIVYGKNTLYNCDCLDLMKTINDNTIQLTVTSPPYYNLKQYEDGFSYWKSYNDYIEDNKKWFKELYRITRGGGMLYGIFKNVYQTLLMAKDQIIH